MFSTNHEPAITYLRAVNHILMGNSCRGYVVGGTVRDIFLKRQTKDIDMAVNTDALAFAQMVAEHINGKYIVLDRSANIARIVVAAEKEQWNLDISSFEGDIASDLARRDFTINAMAIELSDYINGVATLVIDPFSGMKDLEKKVLRAVNSGVFNEDPARLLRAIRQAVEFDFEIEKETEWYICNNSKALSSVAGERIREELLNILEFPNSTEHFRELDRLGLLEVIIPAIAETKCIEQPTVHFWDVFEHSLQTIAAIEYITQEGYLSFANAEILNSSLDIGKQMTQLSVEVSSGSNHRKLLKIAALLHDIAKPRTKTLSDSGRARFLGHAKEGATMAVDIMERLRFSRREIELVSTMIGHHLHPVQMASEGWPTSRAVYRYFRDTDEAAMDILLLAMADYLACVGPLVTIKGWKQQCKLMSYIIGEHNRQLEKILPDKIVSGHDLMHSLGLPEGPLIGQLITVINEAQASGEISNKNEALALAKEELNRKLNVTG
jgi:poly(A) polymerase